MFEILLLFDSFVSSDMENFTFEIPHLWMVSISIPILSSFFLDSYASSQVAIRNRKQNIVWSKFDEKYIASCKRN